VLFHTDAVQAVGAIPLDVQAMHIDLLSLSAHKFHGPKGVGALYVRKGVKLDNLVHGGAQERGYRAGTENLPGIVGMGKAIEIAAAGLADNAERMTRLREKLIAGVMARIPEVQLNDRVVLVGRSGNEEITVETIAAAAGSFNYEFICGISRRVPRIYSRSGKTVHSVHYLLDT
jgi:cysteine sulfinate desulfinase/cysteine desulfurase-like protein